MLDLHKREKAVFTDCTDNLNQGCLVAVSNLKT